MISVLWNLLALPRFPTVEKSTRFPLLNAGFYTDSLGLARDLCSDLYYLFFAYLIYQFTNGIS